MRLQGFIYIGTFAFCLSLASVCSAQNALTDAKPADQPAAPLSEPVMTGPLQELPPLTFDAGHWARIDVNGIVSGGALVQGNHAPGDSRAQGELSNSQVFIQKPDGWFQFYLQVGAYNLPSLATPFLKTHQTVSDFFGPVPVGFVKLQAGKNTSFLVGALPTLLGGENTFTFENMNIERGLLWSQKNAIDRGVQVNQTMGKVTASLSWNDGFYSNRYTWLSGSVTYADGPHSLAFAAAGNYGQTAFQTAVTPVQNNSSIYSVIYTEKRNAWIIQPYFQFTNVPTNAKIGIAKGASTAGGALLISRSFKHGFSLPARLEYISSTGTAADQSVNLVFGPGSSGASLTMTPTIQYGGLFFRADFAAVHAFAQPGFTFGPAGTHVNQPRAMAEIGFILGNNVKKYTCTIQPNCS